MKYKYKRIYSIGTDHICTLHLLYFISSLFAKTKQFPSCGSQKKKKKKDMAADESCAIKK